MNDFEEALRCSIEGEVYFDEVTRAVYSVDASIFEVRPQGVAIPKTKQDLQNIVRLCRQYGVPLTVRGAATGITGGCLGRGLVVDVSKWLNRLLTVDIANRYVICEPGLVQDDLNRALAPFGFRLGPDTSTGNRATIGGMVGNNAAGARSLRYGAMANHLLSVELLAADGEFITFEQVSRERWEEKCLLHNREGIIYQTLKEIQLQHGDEIARRFPPLPRRVSGYRLEELLNPNSLNVAKMIAGSEGTLGIATEIKLNIVPKLQSTALLLLFYSNITDALRESSELLSHRPLSLELVDAPIINTGRETPQLRGKLDWLPRDAAAMIIVEMEGETVEEACRQLEQIEDQLTEKKLTAKTGVKVVDPQRMQLIWELRKAGLGILLSKRSYRRAIAFIEDLSVPPEELSDFMEVFSEILRSHGKEASIYGHVGAGCLHIRPYIDLRDPSELTLIKKIMEEVATLISDYGGAMSGEHGDGLIRSWLNPLLFGEEVMNAFKMVKQAFDPDNLMNPNKVIPQSQKWEELRTTPGAEIVKVNTFLDFTPEGGFDLAVDLCNGNGLCRKKEKVMCPSFQVTGEEFHSTRARAQALRAVIHRRLPLESLTSEKMYDVMDLCLSCKGCKSECPSQVDMAKMKSEFLYHYQEKNGYSLRNQIFGHIGAIDAWSTPFAGLINRIFSSPLGKKGLSLLGITPNRALPQLAPKKFSHWFSTYQQPLHLPETAVLMNDTFTEYHHPHIGQAAVELLNKIGFKVILAPWNCCGRPALSKGLLPHARKKAQALVNILTQYAREGLPIIGLEPSCLLTVKDDYRALLPEEQHLERLLSHCWTMDEFLAQQIAAGAFPHFSASHPTHIHLHGHCYQKAIVGMDPTLKVLKAISGCQVHHIPSGCCGMAGSFGYEKEHADLSLAIGEMILFPAIRSSGEGDLIVASGTSCREQIAAGTGRQALHLAELLTQTLFNVGISRSA